MGPPKPEPCQSQEGLFTMYGLAQAYFVRLLVFFSFVLDRPLSISECPFSLKLFTIERRRLLTLALAVTHVDTIL